MADIHGGIEECPGGAPHKIDWDMRLALGMQAAGGALADAARFIVLNEDEIADMLSEQIGREGFPEIASFIPNMAGDPELDAGKV